MPSNEPLNLNKLYQTNDIIMLVKGEITEKDVSYLNGLNKKIILVLKNTKGQNSQIIKKLNGDNITFSVLGGLDYNSQKKFRSYDYVSRTLNSPQVLAKIIEEYEAIERGIDPSWDDTLKCAYVYKTLTEKLHYKYNNEETYCRIGSHTYEVTRSLSGIIFGRLVCSGFALVFKEAMDRLGIPCVYQNKKGHHSWNIVKLAGAYRGIELTWECYSKENNSCSFDYFGLNPNFYQESSHDISNDKDETMYPLKPFQQSEIQEIIKKVNKGLIKEEPFFEIINNDGIKIYYYGPFTKYGGYKYFILYQDKLMLIDIPQKKILREAFSCKEIEKYQESIPSLESSLNSFTRRDGSTFILMPTSQDNQINKGPKKFFQYSYFEYNKNSKGEVILTRYIITSESNLITNDPVKKEAIANNLLSQKRLSRKIKGSNGYIGYLNERLAILYDTQFESEDLGIRNRL